MDKLAEGKRVFDVEIEALRRTRDSLDDTFVRILDLVTACTGKVIMTGMGKAGHVAEKIAATFSSLGTPSFFLHPGEAMHGDLGMVSPNDVVIAVSYSGESDEVVSILPNIRMIGAALVGITGNSCSLLANAVDIVQVLPNFDEACHLGLAPTSSTTSVLCYGDALAVAASGIYGYRDADFGKFHPAGVLGKKLVLKVKDVMVSGTDNAVMGEDVMLKDVIIELSRKGLGIVSLVSGDGHLRGVVTDGDLRRQLEKGVDIYRLFARDVMSRHPFVVDQDKLAVEALKIMRDRNVTSVPVVDGMDKVVGTIRLHDMVGIGIMMRTATGGAAVSSGWDGGKIMELKTEQHQDNIF